MIRFSRPQLTGAPPLLNLVVQQQTPYGCCPNMRSLRSITALLLLVLPGCTQDSYRGWTEVTSAEHKFKVKMPATAEQQSVQAPDGRDLAVWNAKEQEGNLFCGFSVTAGASAVPDGAVGKAGYDVARDRLLERFNAKLVKESDFVRDGKVIGRQVEVEIPGKGLRGQTVLVTVGGRDYQLAVMGTASAPGLNKAGRFFKSFEVLP